MDIYLPGPAVTTFGTFPAGINVGVSETAAAHLALYHGAVAYTPGSHPRVLSAQKAAAFDALVSADGNPLQLMVDNAAAILALVGVSFGSTYVVGDYVVAGYVL